MFSKTEIPFRVEGLNSEMKLVYGIFGHPKLYQNGIELKKEGLLKMKFLIETDSGKEYMEIKRGLDFTFSAVFRGKKQLLEEKLNTLEYILGVLPLLLIFVGGVIGAILGILGTNTIYGFLRKEKKVGFQLIISIGITAFCYIAYLLVALLLTLAIR